MYYRWFPTMPLQRIDFLARVENLVIDAKGMSEAYQLRVGGERGQYYPER